jgi:predicted DNA-binding transcriptional regulator YafY
MLSEQESLLLTLAEQHLRNLLPAALMKSMESFFSQARSNLGQLANSKREREWISKVRVVSTTQPLLPPKIIPSVFDAVSNALYANRWLKLEYKNAAGKKSKAEVMPLGLAQQGPRLYLVCRFKGYDNERSLALHRIVSAVASTLTFERPKEFNLQQYDDDGRFGFGEGKRTRLTFRIEKEAGFHLLESPLSTDQQVKEIGDRYEISATVVDTAQLEWWLRGFGARVSNIRKSQSSNDSDRGGVALARSNLIRQP